MQTRENILSKLRASKSALRQLGVSDIGLFGSYARNEQTEDSDIDLLIAFDSTKESYDNFMAVYDILERCFINDKIEVVTKNGLSKHIGPFILKEVIYA
ncbi:MAG: nucleotidyltransferase family protein [Chitinophagaceae bacterium]|nr:nucleotidyltransferase family protein [Chitinophagaceae bacterium]